MANEKWTHIVRSRSGWFDLKISQLWDYRDLIFVFVRRDFVSVYQQTLLGPFWHLLQPLMSSLIFALAFSFIGKIYTEQIHPVIFYMSGIVPWSYFADCTNRSSATFASNAGLFGKVYFPRLAVPLSIIISSLLKFLILMFLFLAVWMLLYITGRSSFDPNPYVFLLPVLLIIMAALGTGIGLIVSSITVRYRDLANLVGAGIQFLMYLSPVIFPASIWPEEVRWIVELNPMSPVIDIFRYGFLGISSFNETQFVYSIVTSFCILLAGVLIYNKTEKNFIDTI